MLNYIRKIIQSLYTTHSNKYQTDIKILPIKRCFKEECVRCFKRDFIIQSYKWSGILCNTAIVYQTPLPFQATQIRKTLLLIQSSQPIMKIEEIQIVIKSLCHLLFLQCRISFDVLKCFYFAVNVLNNNEYTVKFWYFY